MFLGAHISQPPQNALYHTVQMVLVDPCERLIFASDSSIMTDNDPGWVTMVSTDTPWVMGVPGGLWRDPGGTSGRQGALSYFRREKVW